MLLPIAIIVMPRTIEGRFVMVCSSSIRSMIKLMIRLIQVIEPASERVRKRNAGLGVYRSL